MGTVFSFLATVIQEGNVSRPTCNMSRGSAVFNLALWKSYKEVSLKKTNGHQHLSSLPYSATGLLNQSSHRVDSSTAHWQ